MDNNMKSLEIQYEENKVKETIDLINSEIINYVEKRKAIGEHIIDYRKNVIEEYKDDEDKLIEYFDHERFVVEEAFRTIDKKLKELNILTTTPYFGKVNFWEENSNEEESIYIGRFGMTPDGEYEPVIIDWRAPVSSLFYAGKLGEASYMAPMGEVKAEINSKRQFIIKKAKLLGMFDSEIDVKDEVLQMVLSGNSSEKLRDIIMTIQSEQDNIIRQPRNKTIVVNGVAGSGKTTIALHRVAYLLYNYREILQDKVLILGPNKVFMEYISTVLPSLGEVGVKQATFNEFAMELLDIKNVMKFSNYMERILANDEEFVEQIINKNSIEYLDKLEKLIHEIETNYFKIEDITFGEKIIVTGNEIEELFNIHYKKMPLFNRTKKIKRIIFSKIKDERDNRVREIQKDYEDMLKNLSPEQLNIEVSNLSFQRKLKIREVIKEVINIKENMVWLNNPSIVNIYQHMNGNKELIQDDLAPLLFLKVKLEGYKVQEEIKHIVIDEAQDYSLLQFIVIKELTKCQSLTIVGDINQRIIPNKDQIAMINLEKYMKELNIEYFRLNRSYRSTKEIMEYANTYINKNSLIPLVRSGKEVVVESFNSYSQLVEEIRNDIAVLKEKGYESIAIVCDDLAETHKIGKLLKEKVYVKIMDEENMLYKGGEIVIPSYLAKGLEFDCVIVIDNDSLKNDKLKYVKATRALHELYVYKVK